MQISVPLQLLDLELDGFHLLVEAEVFGKTFTLVLDTGASKTAFDTALLLAANPDIELKTTDKLSTGLGTNTMESFTVQLSGMKLGGTELPEFDVAVLDLSAINIAYGQLGHPEVLGVLGGDVLVKYKAVIDYGDLVMRIFI